MKVSDCCGVPAYSNGDSSTEDYGICPECLEHCDFINDEECEECNGSGQQEMNIDGADVMTVCVHCDGSGLIK